MKNSTEPKTYTVSQVNRYVHGLLAGDTFLHNLCVLGEVSNCKYRANGHLYFSLKDSKCTISCVMWENDRLNGLRFRLEDGQKVIVFGMIDVYEAGGSYQLKAKTIQNIGMGQMYEELQLLKERLEKEGLFAREHKLPIPQFPKTIGIVSSLTAAGLADFCAILHQRNPYIQPILAPAQMQGNGASQTVIQSIRRLETAGVDVIVIVRGGGSKEELWMFNDESLARAVYACTVPVISGLGHEIDTPIVEYVADLRAASPTDAAVKASYDSSEMDAWLVDCHVELYQSMTRRIENVKMRLEHLKRVLAGQSPRKQIARKCERIEELENSLKKAMKSAAEKKRHQLALMEGRLHALSPLRRIGKGYGYLLTEDGESVSTVEQLSNGKQLQIYLPDGRVRALVVEIEKQQMEDTYGK